MVYKVKISDTKSDTTRTFCINAANVFNAIDETAKMVDSPEETELISAVPVEVE